MNTVVTVEALGWTQVEAIRSGTFVQLRDVWKIREERKEEEKRELCNYCMMFGLQPEYLCMRGRT